MINEFRKITEIINDEKYKIFFFSEGSHHWPHIYPALEKIADKFKIAIFTKDKNDVCIKLKHRNVISIVINNILSLHIFFKLIKKKILITSLPDLGKQYFKKKDSNLYLYIFHSLASCHTQYNYDAFKNFDIIFAPGINHEKEILEMEKIFNFPKKEIVKYGYPYLEKLYSKKNIVKNKSSILIAPSWGGENITNSCLDNILQILLKNYSVIFRPHPMDLKTNQKIIDKICKKYSGKNFKIDTDIYSSGSLMNSNILIADWGSVAMDFNLGLKKSVIFIDVKKKINNKKHNMIELKSFEEIFRDKVGNILKKDELNKLPSLIENLKLNENCCEIDKFIKKNIYNFGNSTTIFENKIEELIKNLK